MANIGIDKQTGEIIFEEYGRIITDPSEITYIKRHSDWKSKVYELSVSLQNEIDEKIEKYRSFHTLVPKMVTEESINKKIALLKCESWQIPIYKHEPDDIIKNKALVASKKYAICNASSNIIKRAKHINELQTRKMQEFIDFYKAKDSDAEAKYYTEQNIIKKQKDSEYKVQYEAAKRDLLKVTSDDERLINKMLSDSLKEFPSDFPNLSVKAIYKKGIKNTCAVIIQLPSMSCIETRKGNILASGKISLKNRSAKDIKEDWNICCSGLILYVVAKIFNVNTSIERVKIRAEYKSLDKALGSQSVLLFAECSFERTDFAIINFSQILPVSTIQAFSINQASSKISSNSTSMKKSGSKKTSTVKKTKSPFEIECIDELSKDTLSHVFEGLKSLNDRYGTSIFSNEKRLLSALKDIFSNNDAELQILEQLISNKCISGLTNSDEKELAKKTIKDILSANGLPDIDVFIDNLKSLF